MSDHEIELRLNAAIDRWAPGGERERIARVAAKILIPEVKQLIREAVKESKGKQRLTKDET